MTTFTSKSSYGLHKKSAAVLFIGFLAAWSWVIVITSGTAFAEMTDKISADRPNVIILLADDMGWTGPSCFGSDLHKTPNIDALALRGIRFTNGYAACTVCSPTRASIMTGKYPARLHLTDWIHGYNPEAEKLMRPEWCHYLPLEEVTIAEALRSDGYKTAHLGKWHLGDEAYSPEKQGFDVNIGGTHVGSPPGGYFLPNQLDLPGNSTDGITLREPKKGEYLTDYLGDAAAEVIHNWSDQPFFMYMAFYTVHTPIQGKKDLTAAYESQIQPDMIHRNSTYAAMHQSLDEAVGKIIAALDETNITRRTIIIFSSDNGGLSHKFRQPTDITLNTPLRRGKGGAYEGGVRVPLIVSWPGVSPEGVTCDEPVCSIDFYPTILEITGTQGDASHNASVDGVSIAPLLRDPMAKLERDEIFWHYPHYHPGGDSPYSAIRSGQWKLIEFHEDGHVELFSLNDDLSEAKDLANENPEVVRKLKNRLTQWRKSVNAQMPLPNPNYNPAKAKFSVP